MITYGVLHFPILGNHSIAIDALEFFNIYHHHKICTSFVYEMLLEATIELFLAAM